MDDNVHVVVPFDIVEADVAGKISLECQIIGWFREMGRSRKGGNRGSGESWG